MVSHEFISCYDELNPPGVQHWDYLSRTTQAFAQVQLTDYLQFNYPLIFHLPQGHLASFKGTYPHFRELQFWIWHDLPIIHNRYCCMAMCSLCLGPTSCEVSPKLPCTLYEFYWCHNLSTFSTNPTPYRRASLQAPNACTHLRNLQNRVLAF